MNFTLRQWKKSDLECLVKYANNPKISQNLTDAFPSPYTRKAGRNFIAFAIQDKPLKIFAIDVNNEAVGAIGIHPQTDVHRKNAELGYWLAEKYWGKGIMTKAVIQMVDYGFKTFDINRIFARPFGINTGSQRVLEKAGFVLEAKLEKTLIKSNVLLDELIYAVRH